MHSNRERGRIKYNFSQEEAFMQFWETKRINRQRWDEKDVQGEESAWAKAEVWKDKICIRRSHADWHSECEAQGREGQEQVRNAEAGWGFGRHPK